jgi:hypothetical protein
VRQSGIFLHSGLNSETFRNLLAKWINNKTVINSGIFLHKGQNSETFKDLLPQMDKTLRYAGIFWHS